MSKQSDIKEGLIQITKSKPMAYQLLRFLVDNNCVLKVDRELPLQVACDKCHEIFTLSNEGLSNAGYEAVESLIKEGNEILLR